MRIPAQITFRNIPYSETLADKIRNQTNKLEQFFPHIISCRVAVDSPHHHKNKGYLYRFRIDITVPGNELVVTQTANRTRQQNAHTALMDAFRTARRRLKDYAQRKRKDIKHHTDPPHGRILDLYPDMDYGVIQSHDGREIYFHRNSIINDRFARLTTGTEVRFALEQGEQGPQASSLHVIGKHHIRT